jgi:hypothetical protein
LQEKFWVGNLVRGRYVPLDRKRSDSIFLKDRIIAVSHFHRLSYRELDIVLPDDMI